MSFRPLQGIFNLIILVGHKAYDNMLINRSLTARQAVVKVFREREKVKFLLSNVSLVRDDQRSFYFDGKEEDGREEDIWISDNVENHDASPISGNIRGEHEEEGISSAREDIVFHEDAGASNPKNTRDDKSTSEKNSQSSGIDSRISFSESWESRRTGSRAALSSLLSRFPSMVSSTGLEGNQDRVER